FPKPKADMLFEGLDTIETQTVPDTERANQPGGSCHERTALLSSHHRRHRQRHGLPTLLRTPASVRKLQITRRGVRRRMSPRLRPRQAYELLREGLRRRTSHGTCGLVRGARD